MRWILPVLLCALAPSLSLASVDTDGDGLMDDWERGLGRYQVIEGVFTWEQAKADAEARGGKLATVTSESEWTAITTYAGPLANTATLWLGSRRPAGAAGGVAQGWQWVSGEKWNYTRWWWGGEPNSGNFASADCYLNVNWGNQDKGSWNDSSATDNTTLGYILEFGNPTDPNKADSDGDGYDDKIESDFGTDPNDRTSVPADAAVTVAAGTTTVEVVQGSYTWNQAMTDAINRGGRLAVFPTGDVYDRTATKIRNSYTGYFWLGGSDAEQEGVWRWIDGSSITYGRWQAGEPNNQGGTEDSLHVVVGNTIWNDATNDGEGNWRHAYALEKRPLSLLSLPFVAQGAQWSVDYSTANDYFSSAKAQTTDGQSTYREYTVTGPAVVDFWWKVSSEDLYDTFSYSVNGVNQQTISGELDWTYRTLTLPEGTHTIRWTYTKDGSDAVGQDAGWLDDFAVHPATATLQVRDGATVLDGEVTVDFGSADLGSTGFTKTLTFANNGYVPLEVQLSLPEGSPFTFDGGAATYGLLVGRGESVDVPITLATTAAGTNSVQLVIDPPYPIYIGPTPQITLTGYVRGPDIGLAQGATTLTSGQTFDMGLAPRTVEFTIRNNGNVGDLVISAISATGNFQITQQPATTIPPQGSTTFKVLAQSIASGIQTGAVSITCNAANLAEFILPLSSKSLTGIAQGITDGSMATSGTGGAVGWDFATTELPSGQSGQALRTGTTPNAADSVLAFTTQNAGVISWSWKVGSQENFDWLLCEVDGQEAAGISTKNGVWQTQVVQVPAGANIRWVYRKDGAFTAGEDAGYLADVEFRSFAANQSFSQWAQTHGIYDPQQRMPKSGLKAMFGWLGGLSPSDPTGHWIDDWYTSPPDSGPRKWPGLPYSYPVSKTADGTQQILYSSDMTSWTTRRISQRVVSEDADRMVIEATAPIGTKGFFKVVGGGNTSSIMVRVQGGELPLSSELAGTAVVTFHIGRTEVTLAEWQEVRSWAVANGYSFNTGYNTNNDVGSGNSGNHPVTAINWYDAVTWCNAKSEKEGLTPVYWLNGIVYRYGPHRPTVNASANGYRLPTEEEWEWAARGGMSSKGYHYSGSNDLDAAGWYSLNSGRSTKAVGTKSANELGLYDMSGNVWEMVENLWVGAASGARGGSWDSTEQFCAVKGGRSIDDSYSRRESYGFRVARNAD